MNRPPFVLLSALLCLGLTTAQAQIGGMGRKPQISAVTTKLFGPDAAFSATVEMEVTPTGAAPQVSFPAKFAIDHGKVRLDIDVTEMKGAGIPAEALPQLKAMGMDKTVVISRPDRNVIYTIFPSLKGYMENPGSEEKDPDLKLVAKDAGKETVAGHACTKQTMVVTDKQGKTHEAVVWRSAEVKNLPVKIEQTETAASGTTKVTMTFKNHNAAKPAAALFEPPADGTKYSDPMAMMQGAMQRQSAGGGTGGSSPPAAETAPRRPQQ